MKKLILLMLTGIVLLTLTITNTGCSSTPPIVVSCTDTILSAPYNTGLVAYYKFSNGSLNDFSGNAHNGTIFGVVTSTTNPTGGTTCAMSFAGSPNDFIRVPSHTDFDFSASTPMSIVLWYKPLLISDPAYELLFGRDSIATFGAVSDTGVHCPDTYGQYSLGLYDCRKPVFGYNHISCWDTTTASLLLTTCPATNAYYIAQGWQNLIAVYDPTASNIWTIYRNGIPSTDMNGPCGDPIHLVGDIFIGKGFKGSIDDIKIYNRALTASDILFLKSYVSPCCP